MNNIIPLPESPWGVHGDPSGPMYYYLNRDYVELRFDTAI